MLTPQEARENAAFGKSAFGGYSKKAVDAFLDEILEDYAALYKENTVLQSKLDVMVDKLDEYHNQEAEMKKVLIVAQQTADELVAETERKCARMMSDTEKLLRERSEDLKQELAVEGARVIQAKKTANAFIGMMEGQIAVYLNQLNQLKKVTAPKAEKMPQADPVREMLELEQNEAPIPEPVPGPVNDPTAEPEATVPAENPVEAPPAEPEENDKVSHESQENAEITRQIQSDIIRMMAGESVNIEADEDTSGDTIKIPTL